MRGGWCLFVLLLPGLTLAAPVATPWDGAATELRQELAERRQMGEETVHDLAERQQALRRELSDLRARVQKAEADRLERETRLLALQEDNKALKLAIRQEEQDLDALEGVSRSAAEDALKLVEKQPRWQPEERLVPVRQLAGDAGYPTLEQLTGLVDLLLSEMTLNRRAVRQEQPVIGPDGRQHRLPVERLGPFTALGLWQDRVHYLVQDEATGQLRLPDMGLGWLEQRSLRSFWDGEAETLLFDLSGGAVIRQRAQQGALTRRLRDGGWIVWPILAIGLVAAILVLERSLVLSRLQLDSRRLHDEVRQALEEGRCDAARQACRRHGRNPAARVLDAGLAHMGQAVDVVENAFHEAILRQIPALERFLPTLSVLGAVAPLLGLLGTVTGMIGTFRSITLYGTGNAGLMSGGISEALITTQLGLAVAIPILLLHHFLERRVERIVGRMEQTAVAFVQPLAADEASP